MKKFTVFYLTALLATGTILSSCEEEITTPAQSGFLNVKSGTELSFAPQPAEPEYIIIESDGFWDVTVPEGTDWITLEPGYGNGDASIAVSAGRNIGLQERTTVITVALQDDKSVFTEIAVRQSCDMDMDILENLPDENFRNYCAQFDSDGDGKLSVEEAAEVTVIDITPSGDASASSLVISLEGLGYFTNLESLQCSYNLLSDLDLSGNPKLVELICLSNKLTSIDLSMLPDLEYCYLDQNSLTELDVTHNTELKVISAYTNDINSIDISKCPELTDLNLIENRIASIDLGNCLKLENISLDMNELCAVDVTMLPNLKRLNISSNNIALIDVTNNPELVTLNCAVNKIEKLDISKCPLINTLYIGSNLLTDLDVSNNPELTSLHLSGNQFEMLDITGTPKMVQLMASSLPNVREIDISSCSEETLVSFFCTDCPNLKTIWVWEGFTGIPEWAEWGVPESVEFKVK